IIQSSETARVKSQVSGYQIAKGLREIADSYGLIRSFRTYLDIANQSHPGFSILRRELHSSGISIVDCPSTSRKDVADKAMIVDMLTLAMDESPPSTILVATGDQDLAYALAVLRLRRFKIVLVHPTHTKECLLMQSDDSIDWHRRVLGMDSGGNDGPPSSSSSSSSSSPSNHSSDLSYATHPITNGFEHSAGQGDPSSNSGGVSTCHFTSVQQRTQGLNAASESLIGSPRRPGDADTPSTSKRARSGTLSTSMGSFFPPPPNFPLDPSPAQRLGSSEPTPALEEKAETSPNSSRSSEGFTIVGRSSLDENATASALLVPSPSSPSTSSKPVRPPTPPPPLMTSHPSTTPIGMTAIVTTPTQAPKTNTSSKAEPTRVNSPPKPVLPATPRTAVLPNGPTSIPVTTSKSQPTPTATTSSSNMPTKPSTISRTPLGNAATSPARAVPTIHRPLVKCLQLLRQNQLVWVEQSQVASKIIKLNPKVYKDAGVNKWGKYALKAINDGIILKKGDSISLRTEWVYAAVG
ncbi:hypothetical protein AN958_02367, partial [Leucoagaricus sp. SymC.cos]